MGEGRWGRVGLIQLYSQQYLCMCRSFLLPTSTRGVLDKYKDSVRRRREGGREDSLV